MKKRFKSKKSRKKIFKIIGFLLVFSVSFYISYRFFINRNKTSIITHEALINYLLATGTNNILGENDIGKKISSAFVSPDALFKNSLNGVYKEINDSSYLISYEEEKETGEKTDYIPDPNPEIISSPVVYIYNTHQTENYSTKNLEPYNIKPNVLMVSYVLKERLNDIGIPTIVETNDITEVLRINSWNYASSYKASRILIDDALNKNPTVEWIIDLHRDSVSYESTTTEINGESYAKILLLVGKEHANYEQNLAIATKLNDILKSINPAITRGILVKERPGVNGIYNQNVMSHAILIEMGGQYNSIGEVNRTTVILSEALNSLIKGAE